MTAATRLPAVEAVALFAGSFMLFAASGALVPGSTGWMAVRQVVCLVLPACILLRARGISIKTGLGLTWPRPGALLGAAALGASFWYLTLSATTLVMPQATDPERLAELERQLSWTDAGVAVKLAGVVVTPAICEELLVRGVVARSLRPAFGIGAAVVLSALLFSALHLPAVRMLPAGMLGIALGYAAVATDSVVPAMVVHGCNNLIAVVVLPMWPAAGELIDAYPVGTGLGAAALSGTGALLLWRSRVHFAK